MKTKKAAALTAAIRNEPHPKSYQKDKPVSSLKEQIGQLLLYMQTPPPQNEQQKYWQQFETMLSQYLDLKICGGRI